MRFYNRVAVYKEFGGLGFEEESEKMANSIGNYNILLLANHGILTAAPTMLKLLMIYIILKKHVKHTLLLYQLVKN